MNSSAITVAQQRSEQYFRSLHEFLGPDDLLCIPTTPALAPRKGDPPGRSSSGSGYYPRTLSLTSVAGMGRMPQVSLPIATPAACLWGCRYWRGRDRTQSWRKWQRMLIEKQI